MGVWRSGFAAFLACSVITSEDISTECTPPSCEVRPYGIQRDTWRIYNERRDTWRTERRPTRHVAEQRAAGRTARRRPRGRVAHGLPRATLRTLVHVPRRAWSASFTWLRTRAARCSTGARVCRAVTRRPSARQCSRLRGCARPWPHTQRPPGPCAPPFLHPHNTPFPAGGVQSHGRACAHNRNRTRMHALRQVAVGHYPIYSIGSHGRAHFQHRHGPLGSARCRVAGALHQCVRYVITAVGCG